MSKKLRWSVLVGSALLVLLAGWWTLVALLMGGTAVGFVCLAIDSQRAERAWLWMMLALIAAMLISFGPSRHGCDDDSPAGCSIRAW